MTAEQRDLIRQALDARVRSSLPAGCGGCGMGLDERTPGCKTCMKRHYRRARWRTDAAYRAKETIRIRGARARTRVAA